MRFHEPFTLFPRKMPSGLTVWYYRARHEDGSRTTAWSTGQTTKSAARAHCRKLEKDGKLIPSKDNGTPRPLTFGELAHDFWTWDKSQYIAARLRFSDPKKPAISQRYAHDCGRIVELHLLPTFRRRHLDQITPQEVEAFALRLRDASLAGKTVNTIVSCLRVMLGEAYRAGTLPWDPTKKNVIRSLGSAVKHRGRLTCEEVRALFAEEAIATAWEDHLLYRTVNFVAAATGMRQGEILAIRDTDVRDGFIHVSHSWNPRYGLGPTKTRTVRDVPLPYRVVEAVRPFLGSGGYVFSMNGGESPCTGNRVTEALYRALDAIGVKDRVQRNITFHSWRHWLNSTLRARAVPDDIVRKVTGHGTPEMTENYTEYIPEDYAPVAAVQEEVFG